MAVAEQERGERKRPHPTPQQMSGPFLQFDLESEIAQTRREEGWNDGHTAKTLVKQDDFRVVLIALNPEVPHDLQALEDSAVLVTIAWRTPGRRRQAIA